MFGDGQKCTRKMQSSQRIWCRTGPASDIGPSAGEGGGYMCSRLHIILISSNIYMIYVIYVLTSPHNSYILAAGAAVYLHMTQLLLLGKFEYGGGPIFKVVLEC